LDSTCESCGIYERFEVFTAVTIKNGVFWDVLTGATRRNIPEDAILVGFMFTAVLVLTYAPQHEDVCEKWRNNSTIPDQGTRWRRVVTFTLRPRYCQRRSTWYSSDRESNGTQRQSERCNLQGKSPVPTRIELRSSGRIPSLYRFLVGFSQRRT
jgi:hypothetical protein